MKNCKYGQVYLILLLIVILYYSYHVRRPSWELSQFQATDINFQYTSKHFWKHCFNASSSYQYNFDKKSTITKLLNSCLHNLQSYKGQTFNVTGIFLLKHGLYNSEQLNHNKNINFSQKFKYSLERTGDCPFDLVQLLCCLTIDHITDHVPKTYNRGRSLRSTQSENRIPLLYASPQDRKLINTSDNYFKSPCPITNSVRKQKLHEALISWIKFSEKHGIIWWISYGTLLGSIRNGDIIPYDSDMDLGILGFQEYLIRKHQTPRGQIKENQFNLVARPGTYCKNKLNERLDCNGHFTAIAKDTCSFCGPLARVFRYDSYFVDIFPIYPEVSINATKNMIQYGFRDDEINYSEKNERLYPLSMIFPLQTCTFMNLSVPCPLHYKELLKLMYGENYYTPKYVCEISSGKWKIPITNTVNNF